MSRKKVQIRNVAVPSFIAQVASRNEHDLDGLRGRHHHLDPVEELGERKLVRDDVLNGQLLVRHHLDGLRPLAGAEVAADYGQLLAVADDAPVGRDLLPEDCVLHEAAVPGDAVEALAHRLRVARELDVHVAAVAVGQGVDLFLEVHLGRIQRNDVGTAFLGYFELRKRGI